MNVEKYNRYARLKPRAPSALTLNRSRSRVTEASSGARRLAQLLDFVPRDAHDRRDDELCDAHAAADGKRFATEIDQRHANLAAIVGVDRRRRVRQADAVLHGEPRPRPHLTLEAVRNRHLESRRNERDRSRRE